MQGLRALRGLGLGALRSSFERRGRRVSIRSRASYLARGHPVNRTLFVSWLPSQLLLVVIIVSINSVMVIAIVLTISISDECVYSLLPLLENSGRSRGPPQDRGQSEQ